MPPGLPAPSGGGGADVAVVIGPGPEAVAFVVWLTVGRGVPAERVTLLRDPTPAEARAAVASAAVGPAGQFWGVVVGADPADLAHLVSARDGPAVWWVDAWDTVPPAAVPSETALVVAPGATPLALGALRGWADADQDGVTTTAELAAWCTRAAASLPGVPPVGRLQVVGDPRREWSRGTEPQPPLDLPEQVPFASIVERVQDTAEVKGCFAAMFARGELPDRITLRFTVPATGRAEGVFIDEAAWRGSPLEDCLADALAPVPFPLSSGAGATVSYPFVLR